MTQSAWLLGTLVFFSLSSCKTLQKETTGNPAMSGQKSFSFDDKIVSLSIDCVFSCQGSSLQNVTLKEPYSPEERGLTPGNGGLWGGMATDIQRFGETACLAKAQSMCKTLTKVNSVELKRLHSGNWEFSAPLLCDPEKPVLSPFEPRANADLTSLGTSKSNLFDVVDWLGKEPTKIGVFDCRYPVSAKVCYGDCMVSTVKDGDDWVQTLASKASATAHRSYCGDELVRHLNAQNIRQKTVREMICREYFWELYYQETGAHLINACSAMRAEVDCTVI